MNEDYLLGSRNLTTRGRLADFTSAPISLKGNPSTFCVPTCVITAPILRSGCDVARFVSVILDIDTTGNPLYDCSVSAMPNSWVSNVTSNSSEYNCVVGVDSDDDVVSDEIDGF